LVCIADLLHGQERMERLGLRDPGRSRRVGRRAGQCPGETTTPRREAREV
jgi:hypothetical protein